VTTLGGGGGENFFYLHFESSQAVSTCPSGMGMFEKG
jgi:hypothetical protein